MMVGWECSSAKEIKMRVQGRVALVAGAGMMGPPGGKLGNGRAAAILLAKEGASVVAADKSREAAEATVAVIKENGGEAIAIQGDVSFDCFLGF